MMYNYDARFYYKGVEIHHKAYSKNLRRMIFFGKDLKVVFVENKVEKNLSWFEAKRRFETK